MNTAHLALPTETQLQTILDTVLAETGVPGIAAVVSLRGCRAGATAGVAALGMDRPLSLSGRFEMSCLMKFFSSLVALKLAETGVLDLDSAVGEFIPEFRGSAQSKETATRIGHLMSHISGYCGLDITDMKNRWHYAWDRFVDFFKATSLSFVPGDVFNYEHSEHVILGEVFKRVRARSARQLVHDHIFEPLGIVPGRVAADKRDATVFVANHVHSGTLGRYVPTVLPPLCDFWDASLPDSTISLPDLTSVLEALCGCTPEQTDAIFSPLIRKKLHVSQVQLPLGVRSSPRAERTPVGFGIACAVYADGQLGHNGSSYGQTCAARLSPDEQLCVVVGVNAWSPYARDIALERIGDCVKGTSTPAVAGKKGFSLLELTHGFAPDEVIGTYDGSFMGQVSVSIDDNALKFNFGSPSAPKKTVFVRPINGGLYHIDGDDHFALGFFPVPGTNEPAFVAGVHTYRKRS